MCGRYYRKSDMQRIAEAFQLSDADEMPLEVAPSYNVAPTTMQPVIVSDRDTGKRALRVMRWGLIPYWTKDDPKNLGISAINAKGETLLEKPLWKQPFLKRRCLVPADGYYEWQKLDATHKQPFAFAMKTAPRWRSLGYGSDGKRRPEKRYIPTPSSPRGPTSWARPCMTECRSFCIQQITTDGSVNRRPSSRRLTCCAQYHRMR